MASRWRRSWWSGFAIRAVLEERMLQAQLPGYADYAARVRYRFVPLIW